MYTYPIDYDVFTTEEIIVLVEFFQLIEDANEGNINKQKLIQKYREYKTIVNSISLEKSMDRDFEKASGYSIYKTMKNLT